MTLLLALVFAACAAPDSDASESSEIDDTTQASTDDGDDRSIEKLHARRHRRVFRTWWGWRRDAGTPAVRDASSAPDAPNRDASAPAPDAPAPRDSGTRPPMDAGRPITDSGTPATDAGTPATDAGTPATDSGTPVTDSGTPVTDSGTPVTDSGRPVADSGTPAVDAGAPSADSGAPGASPWVWGVTVDNPWATAATVASLAALPRRVTTRVVFDEGVAASEYVRPVTSIAGVSDVMGELLDSFYMPSLTVAQYTARANEYVNTLGTRVAIWEVGNEVNGEWLGATADVVAKVSSAYDVVRARGGRTALTLYYNAGCYERASNEMFTWAAANVPARMRTGLDYVLVSYYEDDCNGAQPDWTPVFQRLAAMFPNSYVGFGEVGTRRAASKSAYLQRYYSFRPAGVPRFIGGYFWWYFSQDMVPAHTPLWEQLRTLISVSR